MNFENWLSRWRLRRIMKALSYATDYGLKKDVLEFAQALEATSLLTRGISLKSDTLVAINCTIKQLNMFISYMTRLHTSKLSLWHRARIGLATLAFTDTHALGETPEEFIKRELPKAKSSKDDLRIITKH